MSKDTKQVEEDKNSKSTELRDDELENASGGALNAYRTADSSSDERAIKSSKGDTHVLEFTHAEPMTLGEIVGPGELKK